MILGCSFISCGETEQTPSTHTTTSPSPASPPGILTNWLLDHPDIAQTITWQFRAANSHNAYTPPARSDKVAWIDWSESQKNDLDQAFSHVVRWFESGTPPVSMPYRSLTDHPVNRYTTSTTTTRAVIQVVDPTYFWKLYCEHVAFSLALEIHHLLPWSITDSSVDDLRYLFDSSTMAWRTTTQGDAFSLGTYAGVPIPLLRADNLPQTTFASPFWVYSFLQTAGRIGATRHETIGLVLAWMRDNLVHFYGPATIDTYQAIWHYRGFPPVSSVIQGTVDTNNPNEGLQHWTAGCHGSVGFLHTMLRVLNIPVQPVWVCGHELAYFPSEDLYLDHGDAPYNLEVKAQAHRPITSLLIDRVTYQKRFTRNLTFNIPNTTSQACNNVGQSVHEFR